MSAKGQIVIPKDVRDRLRLRAGDKLEIVESATGVTLKRMDDRPRITMEELEERLRPIRESYKGPPVTIEEMNRAIDEGWAESAGRSNCAGD